MFTLYPYLHLLIVFLVAHFFDNSTNHVFPWATCHLETSNFFIARSTYTIFYIANVSLALLSIFTQNRMLIRCSKFLLLIFPPVVQNEDLKLLLLLVHEWFIWSLSQGSWNMSGCAQVQMFASYYPSDILQSFRELANLVNRDRTKRWQTGLPSGYQETLINCFYGLSTLCRLLIAEI